VLPTKGLTLPLMSYGRSSLIVSLVWVVLLLRVYHETMLEKRGSATVRQRSSVLGDRQARVARDSRAAAKQEPEVKEPPAMKGSTAPQQGELLGDDWDEGEPA